MKTFEDVKIGYEIEFINSENKIERGIVDDVDCKKFTVEVLRYSKQDKSYYPLKLAWFLSGKKTNKFYNYGEAIRIVNKWINKK